MYDNFWWLGCVLSVSEESNEVKISSLLPCGPSASYIYPATLHILQLSQSAVLAKVISNTATGHTYTLKPVKRPNLQQRDVKHTSVTSTNQDVKTSHFSWKLSLENVFLPNVL
jgi:hypothetical protein